MKTLFLLLSLSFAATPEKFTTGVLSSTCAPHDGPAKLIQLKTKEGSEYPFLSVVWWTDKREIKIEDGRTYEAGFSLVYCHAKNVCPQVKKIEIKWKQNNSFEYHLQSADGEKLDGDILLQEKTSNEKMFCG